MTKAQSPIRIQEDLMKAANVAGCVEHRSTAEQIEYWASIGQKFERIINPTIMLDVLAGFKTVTLTPADNPSIAPEDLLAGLESDRHSGALAASITSTTHTRYQSSSSHPGLLERIAPDGKVTTGKFINGEFIKLDA